MKRQILPIRPANYNKSAILISILYLVGLIDWSSGNSVKSHHRRRGRPYVYSPTIILRCFIVRIWFRLDSNRSLHHLLSIELPYNRILANYARDLSREYERIVGMLTYIILFN
ncbi:hypothetical protein BH23THE1_BH23THE1_35250 [soil metagenome]